MSTLAELIAERRAQIDTFNYDLYDGEADIDISGLRHKIGMTPIGSKADALAALDLISQEAKKQEPDLIIEMALAAPKIRRCARKPLTVRGRQPQPRCSMRPVPFAAISAATQMRRVPVTEC